MINTTAEAFELLNKGVNLEKSTKLFNGKSYSLVKIKDFLDFAELNKLPFKVIHVAGSKGKGTCTHMIAKLIESSKYRCGVFASPHVYDVRERFCKSNDFFDDFSYIKAGAELENLLNNYGNKSAELTYFERSLAFALLLFKQEKMDYVVLETGMGGRWDATNAVSSIAEVFTTIELEHTSILGDTLTKIAIEKSKIIKPHTLVFALSNAKEVDDIFKTEAADNDCSIYFLNDCISDFNEKLNDGKAKVSFKIESDRYDYNLNSIGKGYALDSALAVLTCRKLDFRFDTNTLEAVKLPARFERCKYKGLDLILDGAHTPASISDLVTSFSHIYKNDLTLIFGCAIDKDSSSMAKILSKHFKNIILLKPGEFKESDIYKVYNDFKPLIATNQTLTIAKTATEALTTALTYSKPTLITGSFYLCDTIKSEL